MLSDYYSFGKDRSDERFEEGKIIRKSWKIYSCQWTGFPKGHLSRERREWSSLHTSRSRDAYLEYGTSRQALVVDRKPWLDCYFFLLHPSYTQKSRRGTLFSSRFGSKNGRNLKRNRGIGQPTNRKLRHLIERGLHCWSGEIYKTPPPFFCRVCRRPSTEPCTLIRNISTFSYENGGVLHQPTDGITATNSTPP